MCDRIDNMEVLMKDIGKSIKYYRGQCHMTQKELAEKLQLSPSTVGMYEQNRRMPDINTLKELANIFNISINDILDDPNNANLMYCSEITNRILNLDKNSSKNIEELKPLLQTEILYGYCTNLDLFLSDIYTISDFYGVSDEYIMRGLEINKQTYDHSLDGVAQKFLDIFLKLNEYNRDIVIGDMQKLLKEQRLDEALSNKIVAHKQAK